MLIKKDYTKLQEIFITKEEFGQEFSNLKNDIFTRLDAVMYELKAIREEITLVVYRQHAL